MINIPKSSPIIGIYKITNPKGKIYVGQSTNIEKRFKYYKRLQCKGQQKLYNSLKKYGVKNHIFEKVEECSIELLNDREIYWGNFYNVIKEGLNLKELGTGGNHIQETKDKISKKLKGRDISSWKHKIYTETRNSKVSKSNKGRKCSEEFKNSARDRMIGNEYCLGRELTEEHKNINRNTQLGTKHSKEHIENYKKSMVGKNLKPIICVTTGVTYNSTKEASEKLNINSRTINNNLKGLSKELKNKMKFEYITNN